MEPFLLLFTQASLLFFEREGASKAGWARGWGKLF
jgi:hypothetical protein